MIVSQNKWHRYREIEESRETVWGWERDRQSETTARMKAGKRSSRKITNPRTGEEEYIKQCFFLCVCVCVRYDLNLGLREQGFVNKNYYSHPPHILYFLSMFIRFPSFTIHCCFYASYVTVLVSEWQRGGIYTDVTSCRMLRWISWSVCITLTRCITFLPFSEQIYVKRPLSKLNGAN